MEARDLLSQDSEELIMADIKPFKISVPDSELQLLNLKVQHSRLPTHLGTASWTEASADGINLPLLQDILSFWKSEYSWRDEEARLNEIPQFQTLIDIDGFGSITTHFVHSRSPAPDAIPLLFLHGWPGSFIEITKSIDLLNNAKFHVVAPSHAGWAYSSYPDKKGYKLPQYAEAAHKLMLRLGYQKYYIQGGDWGAHIGRIQAIRYPDHVSGLHLNNIGNMPKAPDSITTRQYTPFEQHQIASNDHFLHHGHAYAQLQNSTPLALGLSLHDSPLGLLSHILEKLLLWSDSYPRNPQGYKWQPREIITWILIHYFSTNGPTGGFGIYREFEPLDLEGYVSVPTGVSAFWGEAEMVPRAWAECVLNVVWYREKGLGGHFAMYEQPESLVGDVREFVDEVEGRRESG